MVEIRDLFSIKYGQKEKGRVGSPEVDAHHPPGDKGPSEMRPGAQTQAFKWLLLFENNRPCSQLQSLCKLSKDIQTLTGEKRHATALCLNTGCS